MARVLFGWELGFGLGHAGTLLPIARELAKDGYEPIFAVKNLPDCAPLLKDCGFPVLQCPVWPAAGETRNFRAASLADILVIRGYRTIDELDFQVMAWQHLLDATGARLAVSDYSPSLNLAAAGRIPVLAIGAPFTLPPTDAEWLPRISDAVPQMPQERVLANIQEVQRRRGRPILARLPELFAGTSTFCPFFSEIDSYGRQRSDPIFSGPYSKFPDPTPGPGSRKLFTYAMGHYPGIDQIFVPLAKAGFTGEVYIRGYRGKLEAPGFQVHANPVSLVEKLREADLVIHHASAGTSTVALAVGRPQLVFPAQIEHSLIAGVIRDQGVGLDLWGRLSVDQVVAAARRLTDEPRFRNRAIEVAKDLYDNGPRNGLEKIVARCRELLPLAA